MHLRRPDVIDPTTNSISCAVTERIVRSSLYDLLAERKDRNSALGSFVNWWASPVANI